MKPSKKILKRMRPALGTFVEIALEEGLSRDFEQAFNDIEAVEALMSFHRPTSEISLINGLSLGQSLKGSPQIFFVLKTAEEIKRVSQGVFNSAVGLQLMKWDLLPKNFDDSKNPSKTPFLIDGEYIHRVGPGVLDLGGIAKGFAVDEGVRGLKECGNSGYINAGGDVRVFGQTGFPFFIQTGIDSFYNIPLKNKSMATSSVRRKFLSKEKKFISSHVQPDGGPCLRRKTASVLADSCILADGLTKVALMADAKILNECLRHFNAHAVTFDSQGQKIFTSQSISDETAKAI